MLYLIKIRYRFVVLKIMKCLAKQNISCCTYIITKATSKAKLPSITLVGPFWCSLDRSKFHFSPPESSVVISHFMFGGFCGNNVWFSYQGLRYFFLSSDNLHLLSTSLLYQLPELSAQFFLPCQMYSILISQCALNGFIHICRLFLLMLKEHVIHYVSNAQKYFQFVKAPFNNRFQVSELIKLAG